MLRFSPPTVAPPSDWDCFGDVFEASEAIYLYTMRVFIELAHFNCRLIVSYKTSRATLIGPPYHIIIMTTSPSPSALRIHELCERPKLHGYFRLQPYMA